MKKIGNLDQHVRQNMVAMETVKLLNTCTRHQYQNVASYSLGKVTKDRAYWASTILNLGIVKARAGHHTSQCPAPYGLNQGLIDAKSGINAGFK